MVASFEPVVFAAAQRTGCEETALGIEMIERRTEPVAGVDGMQHAEVVWEAAVVVEHYYIGDNLVEAVAGGGENCMRVGVDTILAQESAV